MSPAQSVSTGDGRYATAIAELPLRTRRVDAVAGSIVVVDGRAGWGARLRRAIDEGAVAAILSEPASLDEGEFSAVGDPGVPVIVDRARLRHDVVVDAAATPRPPHAVQVECGAAGVELAAALRDAIGWARVLAGGDLDLRESRVTARAAFLQLERADESRLPATVLLGRRESPASWMRALAIDSIRTEVTLQHPFGSPVVDRASQDGRALSPLRYESTARLALRRALDELDSDGRPTDLAALKHDSTHVAIALARSTSVGNQQK